MTPLGADEEEDLDHDGDDEGDDKEEMFEVHLSGKEYTVVRTLVFCDFATAI